MDKNDSFDGLLQEGRHTTLRSFSWGNREFTISSDKISLYVGGIPYDTKPMLDILLSLIHILTLPTNREV